MSNGDRKMTEVLTDRFGSDGVLKIQVDTPGNAHYLFLNVSLCLSSSLHFTYNR